MYPSLNSDLKIIFYFKFLLPVSVCLCACFLTWGYMHKLNKMCQVIIVSKLFFEEPAARISPFFSYLISFVV